MEKQKKPGAFPNILEFWASEVKWRGREMFCASVDYCFCRQEKEKKRKRKKKKKKREREKEKKSNLQNSEILTCNFKQHFKSKTMPHNRKVI